MRPRFPVQTISYRIVTYRDTPKFVSDCKFLTNRGDAEDTYNSLKLSHDWDGLAFVEVIGESFEILKSHNLGGHVLTLDGEYKILPLNSVIHESFVDSPQRTFEEILARMKDDDVVFCKCSATNTQTQETTK